MMSFRENSFLEGSKQSSPLLACQEFHRGANSGSTWGWLLPEGGKNPEMIFGVGQVPVALHIPSPFDKLPQYEDITSAENYSNNLPTHTTILVFFLLLG